MSDLVDDPVPGQNAPEYSVSEISGAVKRVIEGEFGRIRVRGEVGRVSRPASGHLYLDLKDDRAVLSAVVWKGAAARLRTRPEEGMEVVATGRLTTFAGQSRYQMIIEDIAPAGIGALMAMLERRRRQLEAEGLFAAERKRPLPYLPEVVGVVTSPTGAVIRDILHRLRDRFPRRVLLWPVTVQGEKCADEVAAAIRGFNALAKDGPVPRPDVLIVARGGGSVEDLWGFNEEIVVRAAADSEIPLISAVGHETDTTLIDLAADRRAPTPTAAAEIAVPVRLDLMAHLAKLEERRQSGLGRLLDLRRQRLRDLARALPRSETLLSEQRQRLDMAGNGLPRALREHVRYLRLRLARGKAGALGPGLLAGALAGHDARLAGMSRRLAPELLRAVRDRKERYLAIARRLRHQSLRSRSAEARRSFAALAQSFMRIAGRQIAERYVRLETLDRMRLSLGHVETLERGFAIVRDSAGGVLTTRAAASRHRAMELQFRDGRLAVVRAAAPGTTRRGAAIPPKTDRDDPQGDLF
ncbi:MAG: exodeoxyribonuclease VII large subunit [Paracoccaceae bacterium]